VAITAALSPVVKYHGLARRYLTPPHFLMRPLLNGGTLGGRRMLTVDDLIAAFRSAAIAKGDFAGTASLDHKFHNQMSSALRQLRRLGEPGEIAFRGLLNDNSPHVKSWVAAELLARGDQDAHAVLAAISREPGPVGLSASMTLREYDAGRLGSPFPR
jgi:hypothetical protein